MYLTRNQRNKESFCKLLLNPENLFSARNDARNEKKKRVVER